MLKFKEITKEGNIHPKKIYQRSYIYSLPIFHYLLRVLLKWNFLNKIIIGHWPQCQIAKIIMLKYFILVGLT
jgi:hypothetical protein